MQIVELGIKLPSKGINKPFLSLIHACQKLKTLTIKPLDSDSLPISYKDESDLPNISHVRNIAILPPFDREDPVPRERFHEWFDIDILRLTTSLYKLDLFHNQDGGEMLENRVKSSVIQNALYSVCFPTPIIQS